MAVHKCNICGGNLILTIGSDRAVCDHCGQTAAVDPREVIEYRDIYLSAKALMRTGTLAGYEDALTRLQAISFIPQAKEKAALCEKRMKELRQSQDEQKRLRRGDEGNHTALGVIVVVLTVLFLLAAAAGVGYVIWRAVRGELTQTDLIVIGSVAALLVLLLFIGKIRS